MSEMNEPSMYQQRQSSDWPANAIPKRWVEALFAKMSAFYGARFADLWRGTQLEDVQRAWGVELAKLTSAQMKAGTDALSAFVRPPTLPEFVKHCRESRMEVVAHTVPKLEDLPKMSPEQAAENLAKVNSAVAGIKRRAFTAEWAFRIFLENKPKTAESSRCAADAITSPAGKLVVDTCADSVLREQYRALRQKTIDDYRMRGQRLWGVQ